MNFPTEKEYEIAIVSGVEGKCISLNNYRLAGNKPWGGGKVEKSWNVTLKDLLGAIPELKELIDEFFKLKEYAQKIANEIEQMKKDFEKRLEETEQTTRQECHGAINIADFAIIERLKDENNRLKSENESLKKSLTIRNFE
ncbi:MAG: hypothetical protein WC444_07115 [Candidatus Paceibacterota bacterium]